MKNIVIGLAILIVIFIGGWVIFSTMKKTPTAKIDNRTFKVYVAKTQKEKEIGLSKYNKINNDQGMIFQFGQASYYAFWMKDMKFPIDIIYLKNGKIVTIHKQVPIAKSGSLKVYNPTEPADTVLEVNSGLSQKYNIKVGDKISLSNI